MSYGEFIAQFLFLYPYSSLFPSIFSKFQIQAKVGSNAQIWRTVYPESIESLLGDFCFFVSETRFLSWVRGLMQLQLHHCTSWHSPVCCLQSWYEMKKKDIKRNKPGSTLGNARGSVQVSTCHFVCLFLEVWRKSKNIELCYKRSIQSWEKTILFFAACFWIHFSTPAK